MILDTHNWIIVANVVRVLTMALSAIQLGAILRVALEYRKDHMGRRQAARFWSLGGLTIAIVWAEISKIGTPFTARTPLILLSLAVGVYGVLGQLNPVGGKRSDDPEGRRIHKP